MNSKADAPCSATERAPTAAPFSAAVVLEALPDAALVFGADGTAVTVNQACCALLARTRDELVGRTVQDLLPDDCEATGSGLARLLQRAAAGGGAHRLRTAITANGHRVVLDVAAVRADAEHVLTTWRDVSDQVASENVLIEAYGQAQHGWDTLHVAMDAAPDAIVLLEVHDDLRGDCGTGPAELPRITVMHLNAAAAAASGWEQDDALDVEIADVLPDRCDDALRQAVVDVSRTGTPWSTRLIAEGPAGSSGAPDAAYDATVSSIGGNRVLVIARDVTAQEAALRQLDTRRRAAERTAAHDPLTGLPNRADLERRLRQALMACGPGRRVGVLYCDLDDVKAVNDNHGLRVGDLLLQTVAARFVEGLLDGQTVGRLSGVGFVVILPDLAPGWRPEALVQAVRDAVGQPVHVGTARLTPTLTIGVHVADPATVSTDRDPIDVIAAAGQQRSAAPRPTCGDGAPQSPNRAGGGATI